MDMKIDVHTHVFNMNFFPIAGVLSAASEARGIKIPDMLCLAAEKYFQSRTHDETLAAAPEMADHFDQLVEEIAEMFAADLR
ncbi:MAG: hypothetical protein EOO00_15195, partial [Chitinophagaceae bacterium]